MTRTLKCYEYIKYLKESAIVLVQEKSSLPIFEDMLNDDAKDRRIYIDKETYMIVKTVADDVITEYEYEFNNVEDNIFIQPDINEYEPYVQKKNDIVLA